MPAGHGMHAVPVPTPSDEYVPARHSAHAAAPDGTYPTGHANVHCSAATGLRVPAAHMAHAPPPPPPVALKTRPASHTHAVPFGDTTVPPEHCVQAPPARGRARGRKRRTDHPKIVSGVPCRRALAPTRPRKIPNTKYQIPNILATQRSARTCARRKPRRAAHVRTRRRAPIHVGVQRPRIVESAVHDARLEPCGLQSRTRGHVQRQAADDIPSGRRWRCT